MHLFRTTPVLLLTIAMVAGARAQAQRAEPGASDTSVAPASAAPATETHPNLRTYSSPITDVEFSADSAPVPMDLGLGENRSMDLGQDIYSVVPEGMLGTTDPANPFVLYMALPHRSGDDISSSDATIIAGAQDALVHAAAYHGYDLKQGHWLYQQGICPAMQPGSEATSGVEVGGRGEGSILLHFVREDGSQRRSTFVAVLPRDGGEPRVIPGVYSNVEERHKRLQESKSGAVVNRAIPDEALYRELQPESGWIATSACIAEMGSAYPHIPDRTAQSDDIPLAPPPRLILGVQGDRQMIFTDRTDATHYTVWDEHVSRHGRMLNASFQRETVVPHPVTNPPLPPLKYLAPAPEPPTKVGPYPPGPIAGTEQ